MYNFPLYVKALSILFTVAFLLAHNFNEFFLLTALSVTSPLTSFKLEVPLISPQPSPRACLHVFSLPFSKIFNSLIKPSLVLFLYIYNGLLADSEPSFKSIPLPS